MSDIDRWKNGYKAAQAEIARLHKNKRELDEARSLLRQYELVITILQERMGKTWRRERYESDENSSRSFAKNQKRQWIDLEIMEEAAEFERDLFDQLGSPRLNAEPVAWIRYCDGSYEGPIMDNLIEDVRKKSGEWTPLFERDAETARLRADARFREETTSTCWCETCRPITLQDMRMVLCPECGNKRCPRATNHIYQCTARKEKK